MAAEVSARVVTEVRGKLVTLRGRARHCVGKIDQPERVLGNAMRTR